MKKILVIIFCITFIAGCNKKQEEPPIEEAINKIDYVFRKKDENKDYIILTPITSVMIGEEEYTLNNLEINLESEDINKINSEINSFVNNASKNLLTKDDTLIQGYIIDFAYYITEDFISIIEKSYLYINGFKGEESNNVYVISLNTGEKVTTKELLEYFNLAEKQLFSLIEEKQINDETEESDLNINSYKLYINDKKELCIIYQEEKENESIRKELVLN